MIDEPRILYMAVTADIFELPLCVATNVNELARYSGMSILNIHSRLSREKLGKRLKQGQKSGVKFVRVDMDGAEE